MVVPARDPEPDDRRRASRPAVEITPEALRLKEDGWLPVQVKVLDLSSGGLRVACAEPLHPGTTLALTFAPPGGGVELTMQMEVVWSAADPANRSDGAGTGEDGRLGTGEQATPTPATGWQAGCRFLQLDPALATQVVQLLVPEQNGEPLDPPPAPQPAEALLAAALLDVWDVATAYASSATQKHHEANLAPLEGARAQGQVDTLRVLLGILRQHRSALDVALGPRSTSAALGA